MPTVKTDGFVERLTQPDTTLSNSLITGEEIAMEREANRVWWNISPEELALLP